MVKQAWDTHRTDAELTWGDVIQRCEEVKKADKTPSRARLQMASTILLQHGNGCMVFDNGYVLYEAEGDYTVFWPADWKSYTYYFVGGDGTDEDMIPDRVEISSEQLQALPWHIAASLIGEHRIGINSLHRTGDRNKTDKQDQEIISTSVYSGRSNAFIDPERALIRKESIAEAMRCLSQKQKDTFLLYYRDGLTQEDIAVRLGISQQAVNDRLKAADIKMEKIDWFGYLPNDIW